MPHHAATRSDDHPPCRSRFRRRSQSYRAPPARTLKKTPSRGATAPSTAMVQPAPPLLEQHEPPPTYALASSLTSTRKLVDDKRAPSHGTPGPSPLAPRSRFPGSPIYASTSTIALGSLSPSPLVRPHPRSWPLWPRPPCSSNVCVSATTAYAHALALSWPNSPAPALRRSRPTTHHRLMREPTRFITLLGEGGQKLHAEVFLRDAARGVAPKSTLQALPVFLQSSLLSNHGLPDAAGLFSYRCV